MAPTPRRGYRPRPPTAYPYNLRSHNRIPDPIRVSPNSSSLYTKKEENFDNHQRKNQQTDQLNISNPSYLPRSEHSQKEVISTSNSRDGQIDLLHTSRSSSLPLGYNPTEGISIAFQGEEITADQPDTLSCPSHKLVFFGLTLSVSEKDSLQYFASSTNAMLAEEWSKDVTHVIVAKGAGSSCSRSFEVLMAILLGRWVVHFEWVKGCLGTLPGREASYEVAFSVDSVRTIDGPKKGRMRAAEGAPNLFSGLCFCLSDYMNSENRDRVRNLIATAEGQVMERCDLQLQLKNPDDSSMKLYFVYDDAPLEFSSSTLHKEMEEAGEQSAAGAHVICYLKVLDAIAAYDVEILNVKDSFTSCTSNTSSSPQSQPSHREGISPNSSRGGNKMDQLNSMSSCLPGSQHSYDKTTSKNCERDNHRTHECNTSNLSSLPQCQSSHPAEGISIVFQGEKTTADQPDTSSCPSDQLVFFGLSLSVSEKDSLQYFASSTNAMLAEEWSKDVTHVIVGKGAGSSCSRSFEVLMAILLGRWVVHFEWVAGWLGTLPPDPEAAYEAAFSKGSARTIDGPKKGRMRAAEGGPNLFSGLCFCLSEYMKPDNRGCMRDLIAAAEGRVLEKRDLHLQLKSSDDSSVKPYFVYDVDTPRKFSWSTLRKELKDVSEVAAAGARVICHLKVLDAIAAYDADILNVKGITS